MIRVTLLLSFFLSAVFVFGQSGDRTKMERERQDLQRELKEIQDNYNKVRGQKNASIGQLSMIQRKVEVQNKYVSNINREVAIISDDIYLSTLELNRLQRQLDTLKEQYAKSVVHAYKNRASYNYLNFIFSSNNFNDALKRIAYLKSYRAYRQQQVDNIVSTQTLIEAKKQQMLAKQTQKKSALENKKEQLTVLEEERKEKDAIVAKLKTQEKDLSKQIAAKKKRDQVLKNQIASIIKIELDKQRKEAARLEGLRRAEAKAEADRLAALERERLKAAANNNTAANTKIEKPVTTAPAGPVSKPVAMTPAAPAYTGLNPTEAKLNATFKDSQGSLPWPVDNGTVLIPYGPSKFDKVDIVNSALTIGTPTGSNVKAIFDGEVISVQSTGDAMVVMIKHGKYFTIYSNLSNATVSKGATVSRGTVIGHAAESDDGNGGQVDLQIFNESRNLNPSLWLHR